MLLTSARVVPHIARARLVSLFGAIVTAPSAIVAVTSSLTARLNVPSRPLAVRVSPASWTSTPEGIGTGCLPIREDRKSTRLNSSHRCISYAVFCLKKKKKDTDKDKTYRPQDTIH